MSQREVQAWDKPNSESFLSAQIGKTAISRNVLHVGAVVICPSAFAHKLILLQNRRLYTRE